MFSFAALRLLAAALALSPSPSASPTLPPQIAHVVTSDRSDETLRNAVRTTYVITAGDIARNGYRTISQALASVPGVEIESYGPIGATADYGIRGSSSSETLVLIDGVPAPGGLGNSVQLGTMSTAGVARIEVVEGGGSTLYGQGAIGGIINVITASNKAPASATLAYGTFDDREVRVQDDGLSFEHVNADNSYALPPSTTAGSANPTARSNSDYEENVIRYGIDRTAGRLAVSFRTSLGDDDLGAAGLFPDYSSTSREHDVNEDAGLNLSLRGSQSQATANFFGTRQLVTFDCDVTDPNCFQLTQSLDDESRTGVSVRDIVSGGSERLIYGADLSRGIVSVNDGNGDPVASDPIAQSAAYAQETWIGRRSEFYAGLRGERDGALGGEFSPSAGARLSLSDALTLKLNAASAFRAPNATELYYPYYGNPDLHPERAQVGDATLTDANLLGGVSLGWFDNDTRDLIVATCVQYCNPASAPPNSFPVYSPENVDHAHLAGFTLAAQTLSLHGIIATMNATDLYLASDLDTRSRLPDDAVFTVNLGLRWNGGLNSLVSEAGISERAVGDRGFVDPTQPLFYQPAAYSDLDAYVRLRVASRTLLTLRGANLGNERYAEVAGYPMPGRTLVIELSTSAPEHP